jgi:hypothetical protein
MPRLHCCSFKMDCCWWMPTIWAFWLSTISLPCLTWPTHLKIQKSTIPLLFGKWVKAWSDLPDNPLIHGVWQTSPKQVTYFWF